PIEWRAQIRCQASVELIPPLEDHRANPFRIPNCVLRFRMRPDYLYRDPLLPPVALDDSLPLSRKVSSQTSDVDVEPHRAMILRLARQDLDVSIVEISIVEAAAMEASPTRSQGTYLDRLSLWYDSSEGLHFDETVAEVSSSTTNRQTSSRAGERAPTRQANV